MPFIELSPGTGKNPFPSKGSGHTRTHSHTHSLTNTHTQTHTHTHTHTHTQIQCRHTIHSNANRRTYLLITTDHRACTSMKRQNSYAIGVMGNFVSKYVSILSFLLLNSRHIPLKINPTKQSPFLIYDLVYKNIFSLSYCEKSSDKTTQGLILRMLE